MNDNTAALLTELRTLVGDLGKNGGQISPSVYDTAQTLRYAPPHAKSRPALEWLLAQQHPDGGWESPATPYARDVPTLATLLALWTYRQEPRIRAALEAGHAFLQRQAMQWAEPPIDALPIAAEMILPYLVEEANAVGITLKREAYRSLERLRQYKLQRIQPSTLTPGTPPTHSWEALGQAASGLLPDYSGGIGHSPAATAAWLRQAEQEPTLAEACAQARQYLLRAAAATGLGLPGVVPNVWPITGFEQAYAPYALLITGLIRHPVLQNALASTIDELWIIMRRGHGLSFGEYFTPDVDDTGLATAVLEVAGRTVDPAYILQFKQGDHFCTFRHELNPSVFANAHALYGLASAGERYLAAEQFLCDQQNVDGLWSAEKFHTSWLYTTLEVMLVLSKLGYTNEVKRAAAALVRKQKADGGWGSGARATRLESAYALIALATLRPYGLLDEAAEAAVRHGYQWLRQAYQPTVRADDRFWLGKEPYTPYRVDRIYELSALLAVALETVPQ